MHAYNNNISAISIDISLMVQEIREHFPEIIFAYLFGSSQNGMVEFRNFIVRRYENVDLEIVYAIVKKKLPLFREFIHNIRNT
ncbi:MAG: DUF86 domain-containing protein [Prevotellaceae bacterium]|jgi:uncharacterized protein with HEPN domain|nr:DUF86 domain-containing protein [Prevotellaceae bacterium]